jgi:catechol 2,3-dioxygenase-like lactoylglutathione lyase family enzyme
MIEGGTPTIYVSDMERAVEFYTEVLGLRLESRHGDEWASVDAGRGMTIGLHPDRRRPLTLPKFGLPAHNHG